MPRQAKRRRTHTRLTGCSSQVKTSGAKSWQSFHQGKIRTCLFSLGRDCNRSGPATSREAATHEKWALLRAHIFGSWPSRKSVVRREQRIFRQEKRLSS